MNNQKIINHKSWKIALKLHKQGLTAYYAGNKKLKKSLLNKSFDHVSIISSDLKIPLYDIMMLIRSSV